MHRSLKLMVYAVGRATGLFWLLRRSPLRKGLRILCYHGISVADGDRWKPMLFMRAETFESRLERLKKMNLPVLSLAEAVERMQDGTLPDNAVAITIDDGFAATFEQAVPLLREYKMPATIYVTSYYMEKGSPIFELVIRYMYWKVGTGRVVDLRGLGVSQESGAGRFDAEMLEHLIEYGKARSSEAERVALSKGLAEQLGFDYDDLARCGLLSLASAAQVKEAAQAGIDVQLHTRRHRFPLCRRVCKREIEDNRSDLSPLVESPLVHFCYPSGMWDSAQWSWLEELGVESATTCESGLNYQHTPKYALRRFLDSEVLSEVEFEAELSGFSEFLRVGRRMLLRQ